MVESLSRTVVMVAGGTLTCKDVPAIGHGGREIIQKEPSSGTVESFIQHEVDGKTRALGEPFSFRELPTLKDSSQYKTDDLLEISRVVCEHLMIHRRANVMLILGTDNAPGAMHTVAERVPASLLGDRTVMGVVSQTSASPNRPDGHRGKFYRNDCEPVWNLTNAIYLMTREEFRGRIGVCCMGEVHSPRGLRKQDRKTVSPFYSRFHPWGTANPRDPVPNWLIATPDDPLIPKFHTLPRGDEQKDFSLVRGVETSQLRVTSNYANFRNWMKRLEKGNERNPQTLTGVVITTPGEASILEEERAILAEAVNFAARKEVPIVMVPDAIGSDVINWMKPDDEDEKAYIGSPKLARNAEVGGPDGLLIHGGDMLSEEAALVLSAGVAEAKSRALRGRQYLDAVHAYVHKYLLFMQRGPHIKPQ